MNQFKWKVNVLSFAGVGKSTLINAIVQSNLRMWNSIPGVDPSSAKVLICASTGKAAFNIGGTTLHQAFLLPLNQYAGPIPKLSDDKCNSLSSIMKDLKLVIIDEISMVSSDQLNQVNLRMQQIFRSNNYFGGKSVVVVGGKISGVFGRLLRI
jgi:ATP-dependent DNA helicase PIF1